MDIGAYLVYGVLALFILLAFGALFAPIRWGLKALVHMAFGFLGLVVCNVFGALIGVTVGINVVNTAIVAALGPAGLVLLLLLGWSLT
ncbi:pro-sigmaK processing inhibitor BofA family protein [Intestinibacillus massiliensis]|uniref:pro-sigmaK processing inhibitor BofA family protein n=1 Tax=Intestinibacillus massiliensis TaxID=1871029 RepID=UPI000B360D52|nr:pro-sigmaK processing inhibitor BofA family protein [Intestinibacillus massiliensis]